VPEHSQESTSATPAAIAEGGDGSQLLPLYRGLRRYPPAWLGADLIAGITLAAYAVPVSMAYAALAGLPPHCGIYCYLTGGIAYALLGTSRQLAIGPTSAVAMLVGATVGPLAGGDAAYVCTIASLAAFVTAALCFVSWLAKLSGLVSFISETILTGFKAGAAVSIAMTQLPKLFGVPGGGDHFFERVRILWLQLPQTNLVVLGVGVGAILLLVLGDKLFPGRPVALVVVVLTTLLVSLGGLTNFGVSTVGEIPAGLPQLSLPNVGLRDVDSVIPLAAACFLLSYVESISAARSLAARHGYVVSPRQELFALGAANLAAAVGQGFPVAGGLSQSAVNDKAGGRSPLALVFASLVIGACLLFLSELLSTLPNVVLAAIVLVAVSGLIDVAALLRLRRLSRYEFAVACVALAGVLLLGILKGVLLAVIASVVMLLSVAATPHVAILGRIPGTRRYGDAERHHGNESIPGALLVRIESSLLYFNTEHVRDQIRRRVEAAPTTRLVIFDLSNAPQVDVAGASMLAELHRDLASRGCQMRIVEAHAQIRDLLRAASLEEQLGYLDRHVSLDQAVAEFEARSVPETSAR
jgi:high affinity sulfate transporter 1